jgi:hypothetical protein
LALWPQKTWLGAVAASAFLVLACGLMLIKKVKKNLFLRNKLTWRCGLSKSGLALGPFIIFLILALWPRLGGLTKIIDFGLALWPFDFGLALGPWRIAWEKTVRCNVSGIAAMVIGN